MPALEDDESTPDYVHTLVSGADPVGGDLMLDTASMKDLARQVREIDEARAVAAVSGRDYVIR